MLEDLNPSEIFHHFEELTKIPRGSDNEKQMSDYLVGFTRERKLETLQDKALADLELDALCSSAWLSVDGTRSILDVARIQSEPTGDDIDEAVRRIVQFTRYIAKRGWIRFKEVQEG